MKSPLFAGYTLDQSFVGLLNKDPENSATLRAFTKMNIVLNFIFIIFYFRFIILFLYLIPFYFFVTMVWLLAHIVPPQGWLFLAEEHTSPTTYAAINFAMHSKWTQRRFCIEKTCHIFFYRCGSKTGTCLVQPINLLGS